MLHSRRHDRSCFLYAFDLMERGGVDMRSLPLQERKAPLRSLLVRSKIGIVNSDHVAGNDGISMFKAACEIGLEGIVSKRCNRRIRSMQTLDQGQESGCAVEETTRRDLGPGRLQGERRPMPTELPPHNVGLFSLYMKLWRYRLAKWRSALSRILAKIIPK